jgi:2-polyprenyl-3-methyl-5-hydroxy-6-metoxy-1,4-benzoquinol methylase
MEVEWWKEGGENSPRLKYLQQYLLPELKVNGLNVLDIGCGLGQLFPVLENNGAKKITGIEPSNRNFSYTKEHFPNHTIMQSTLQDYEIKSKFDVVLAIYVFEHIEDVNYAFLKIKNTLTTGGIFYLIVGDKDYSIKPRFNYEIKVEDLDRETIVIKTKRKFGTLYDIFRPVEMYIKAGEKIGFSLLKHIPIKPNKDTVLFLPQYQEFLNDTTGHLLIFQN